jgi:membrane-associated phospholipid phosphatase
MKGIWEHYWFMIPVSLFLGLGMALALLVPYGDEVLFFNDLRREPFISIFRFLSWCGETWIWVVIGLTALFWRYRFTLLIALTGLIIPLVFILKDKVGSDRPITYFKVHDRINEVVTIPGVELHGGQTSFPSGHTMSAFGLFSLLALIAGRQSRKRVLLLAVLAISVGLSRIFLVQHFLVDVLGGALLGMAVSGFVWWLNDRAYFQEKTWLDGRLMLPQKWRPSKKV